MVELVGASLAGVVEEEAIPARCAEDEGLAGSSSLAGSAAVCGSGGSVGEDLEVGSDARTVVGDLKCRGWSAH